MDPKHRRIYTGRSGQLAVIAELLARGVNAAIPEVDVGEDVFAFLDGQPGVDHIQVKTATKVKRKKQGGCSAIVKVELDHLRRLDSPELYYVFPVRLDGLWRDFVIISRFDLKRLHDNVRVGFVDRKANQLELYLVFGTDSSLTCSGQDLSSYRNAWERLPVFKPLPQPPVRGEQDRTTPPR